MIKNVLLICVFVIFMIFEYYDLRMYIFIFIKGIGIFIDVEGN